MDIPVRPTGPRPCSSSQWDSTMHSRISARPITNRSDTQCSCERLEATQERRTKVKRFRVRNSLHDSHLIPRLSISVCGLRQGTHHSWVRIVYIQLRGVVCFHGYRKGSPTVLIQFLPRQSEEGQSDAFAARRTLVGTKPGMSPDRTFAQTRYIGSGQLSSHDPQFLPSGCTWVLSYRFSRYVEPPSQI